MTLRTMISLRLIFTSSSIDRIPIYLALGVPEVWRWHNDTLHVLLVSPDTQYVEVGASRALPGFPFERMVEMLKRRNSSDGTILIREFRSWCRPEHKN